jgi:NTP pyrophosphatase (non-canonical NTP hydrolase)
MDDNLTYYLYHIPGKKIGVTRNLNNRVTQQQGYSPDEYEVLDQSTDIDYISSRELELQKSYGYRVDHKPYKQLFKMKINATEQTSTFPVPLNKLKGRLMDEIGRKWETIHGTFELTRDTVKWIVDNASTSMYNKDRTYIYNKAFKKEFLEDVEKISTKVKDEYNEYIQQLAERVKMPTNGKTVHSKTELHTENRFDLIRTWADQRGLYDKGDTKTQFCKLMEEAGELGRAVLKNDNEEFVDAIGDMVVVLTNLAHLGGTTIEACIDAAYAEIKSRKGQMVNGTFVKND